MTELVDGVAGLLAALLMASLSWFRMLSILLFSHVPMLLLGLLMVWAYLRWRRATGRAGCSPSACSPGGRRSPGRWTRCATRCRVGRGRRVRAAPRSPAALGGRRRGCVVAGAVPFLALQMVFNKGVTGSLWQTPYTYYLQRDQPQTSFGFHRFDPSLAPQSQLAQKRQYYRSFMQPMIERHQPARLLANWIGRDTPAQKAYERPRLPMLVDTTMPFRVLLPLAFAGLLGLSTLPRRTLWASLPLLVLAYLPNTFFLEHYAIVAAPAVILSVVLGVESLAAAWPRAADAIRSASVLGIVTLDAVLDLRAEPARHTARSRRRDAPDAPGRRRDVPLRHAAVRAHAAPRARAEARRRAVPLRPRRQRDRGARLQQRRGMARRPGRSCGRTTWATRNIEIVRYYAERQPDRTFYRFDRAARTLTPLGTAPTLLREMQAAAATTTSTTAAAATTQPAAK